MGRNHCALYEKTSPSDPYYFVSVAVCIDIGTRILRVSNDSTGTHAFVWSIFRIIIVSKLSNHIKQKSKIYIRFNYIYQNCIMFLQLKIA